MRNNDVKTGNNGLIELKCCFGPAFCFSEQVQCLWLKLAVCSISTVALIVWFQGIYCNPPPCCRHTNQPWSEAPVPAAALPASATSTSQRPVLVGGGRRSHVPRARRRRRCGTPHGHVFAGAQNSTAGIKFYSGDSLCRRSKFYAGEAAESIISNTAHCC